MASCWETLGVPTGTSALELRRTWRRLARGCHPDLFPGDARAEERFKRLGEAYRAALAELELPPPAPPAPAARVPVPDEPRESRDEDSLWSIFGDAWSDFNRR